MVIGHHTYNINANVEREMRYGRFKRNPAGPLPRVFEGFDPIYFQPVDDSFLAQLGLSLLILGLWGAYNLAGVVLPYVWAPNLMVVLPLIGLSAAVGVLYVSNPIHSLLCLITVFISTVFLYFISKAEFLALIFLIVYIGAIAILFLFVIMLLNINKLSQVRPDATRAEFAFYGIVTAVTLSGLFGPFLEEGVELETVRNEVLTGSTLETMVNYIMFEFNDIMVFTHYLYTRHAYLFALITLILLTAMLGAIVLAGQSLDTNIKTTEETEIL